MAKERDTDTANLVHDKYPESQGTDGKFADNGPVRERVDGNRADGVRSHLSAPHLEPFIYLSWAKHDGPTTPLHQPPAIFPTMAANGINGAHGVSRPLKAGIYAPIPSFFLPGSEDLGPFRFSSRFPDVLTTLLIQIFPHLSLMLFELPPLASALCFLDQWGRPSICRMLRGSG